MDNITHSLVGLLLARAGLEKTTPHGTAMMVLAANVPDLDGVAWLGGTLGMIEYHRTYTHALVFTPLMALLPMLLVCATFSWRSYLASIAGVLSHLLLDWTNEYGIPLVLPFSNHYFRLDTVNLIDVWIWAILVGAVVAMALAPRTRRSLAYAALAALLAFEGFRTVTHARAIAVMSAQLYEGASARRVTASPGAFNPLAWRGVAEGPGFVTILPVDVVHGAGAGRVYRTAGPIPAMDAALRTHPFQVFTRWSQLPFWKVTPVEEGLRLDLIDLRFGDPDHPGFARVSAIVDRAGKVLHVGF